MGELLKHQESHVYMRDFKGCKWAPLFHFFDFHRKFNFKKLLLSDKKHFGKTILLSGKKLKGSSYLPLTNQSFNSMDNQKHKTGKSNPGKSNPGKSNSGKSKSILRSFIPRKFYRKHGQKQKILPLTPKLLRTISIHHLESNRYVKNDTDKTGTKNESSLSASKSDNIYRLAKYSHGSIKDIDVKKSLSLPSEIRHKWKSPSMDFDASETKTQITADQNLLQNDSKTQIEKNLKQIISMEGVLHKIPYGQKPTENPKNPKNPNNLNLFRSVSVNYEREGPRRLMRRSHSLSYSVDRYANLFDSLSLSRENASKTVQTNTKHTENDESFEEFKDAIKPIEEIHDSFSEENASKPVQNYESFQEFKDEIKPIEEIHESLSEENALETMQSDLETVQENIEEIALIEIQGVDCENESLEMSEKSEDHLEMRREKEEEERESVEIVNEGPPVSETEKESPVSVLDLELQDLQEIGILLNEISPREISKNTPSSLENLPSEPSLTKDPNLENLMDLFENFGFGREDFLEIFDSLIQEVQHEINDFSKIDHNFAVFDYDENMSLDQNLLYALTHETLLEIFTKYFSNGNITNYISVPLEKVLFKVLWRKVNCFVNSKECFDGNNLKSDGWLDLSREREILGVEVGNMIFESLLDELIF